MWGEVLNLGAGKDHSIREFAEIICKSLGVEASVVQYDVSKYSGARAKCLAIEKVKALMEWKPSSVETCVERVAQALERTMK